MCGCNSRIEDYKTLQIENYHYKSLKSSTPQAAPLLPKICLPTKGKKKRHIYHINTFPLTLLPFWPTNLFLVKLKLQCFGHLMWKTDSLEKTLMLGKIWRQEKGTTEDKMVGWLHWLNGHEFEQASGVGDRQGSLECCSPWDCKELDTTKLLNCTE